MSELLHCPFCKYTEIFTVEYESYFKVYCGDCNAATGMYETIEAARDAWNTRADQPAPSDGEMLEAIIRNDWRIHKPLYRRRGVYEVIDNTGATIAEHEDLREAIRTAMGKENI